jgi:hypothetical protein
MIDRQELSLAMHICTHRWRVTLVDHAERRRLDRRMERHVVTVFGPREPLERLPVPYKTV